MADLQKIASGAEKPSTVLSWQTIVCLGLKVLFSNSDISPKPAKMRYWHPIHIHSLGTRALNPCMAPSMIQSGRGLPRQNAAPYLTKILALESGRAVLIRCGITEYI